MHASRNYMLKKLREAMLCSLEMANQLNGPYLGRTEEYSAELRIVREKLAEASMWLEHVES